MNLKNKINSEKLTPYEHFQLYVNYALGLPLALLLGQGSEFRQFVLSWRLRRKLDRYLLRKNGAGSGF
jgi:hypothetical protein